MTSLIALLFALPAVILSAEHEAMNLAAVGAPMPAIQLFSPTGQAVGLADLRGERATVVAVHRSSDGNGNWMSQSLLADLAPEVAAPFADRGVRVVTVSLSAAAKPQQGITTLRANANEAARVLGTGRMPRVYVLNGAGEIVWLDIEYSMSTRRELRETLEELTAR